MKNLKLVVVGLIAAVSIAQAQASVERKLSWQEVALVKADPARASNIRHWANEFVVFADSFKAEANASDIKRQAMGKINEVDSLLNRFKFVEADAYREEKTYLIQLIGSGQLAKARAHIASIRAELDKHL